MVETRSSNEIEQLKAQIEELKQMVTQNVPDHYRIPDPIKNLSEFSGNKKELNAWLEEVDEIYDTFRIKGERGVPDTFNSLYMRAIKNKLKGEARTIVCANGNPNTIAQLKSVLIEHFGDQRDFTTNLSLLFHFKRGDRANSKFFAEIKELNTKLKSNLQLNPLTTNELLEIITITKYLDGISEPLASIIRNSKPKTLEEAYQAVIVNQNAEARKPVFKQKQFIARPQPSTSGAPQKTAVAKFMHKKQFQPKARAENNNNEQIEIAEEEEEEEEDLNEVDDLNYEEQNFQLVRLKGNPV